MVDGQWLADTRQSYDTVAVSYSDQLRDRLDREPYLRATLSLFAELVKEAGGGPVGDIGCGPGHVTAHLQRLGVEAFGIDLSPGMVEVARREHPSVHFDVGSMTRLDLPDASTAGLIAFWSLIHVPDSEIPTVFQQFRRVLRPAGPLLLGFHAGEKANHKTLGYGGHAMNVQVHLRLPDRVAGWLREAGFTVEAQILLDPDSDAPAAILVARNGS